MKTIAEVRYCLANEQALVNVMPASPEYQLFTALLSVANSCEKRAREVPIEGPSEETKEAREWLRIALDVVQEGGGSCFKNPYLTLSQPFRVKETMRIFTRSTRRGANSFVYAAVELLRREHTSRSSGTPAYKTAIEKSILAVQVVIILWKWSM